MAGYNRPAFASESTLFSASSYVENLLELSSYAKIICTKDKDVCLKTLNEVTLKEREAQNTSPRFSIKIVPSNTYIIPQPHPEEPKATLSADTLFDMVNEYRMGFGLIKFEKEESVCKVANERAAELPGEFNNRTLHRGLYLKDLPYFITENAIYARSEDFAFHWWIKSSIHRGQLLSDYKYSCIKCNGRACSQLFTNFTPKHQESTALANIPK